MAQGPTKDGSPHAIHALQRTAIAHGRGVRVNTASREFHDRGSLLSDEGDVTDEREICGRKYALERPAEVNILARTIH